MHDYNTIIGVIGLRNDKVSIPVIRKRYGIPQMYRNACLQVFIL